MLMNAQKTHVSMVPFVRTHMAHIIAIVAMDLEENIVQRLFSINMFQRLGTLA